MPPVGRPPKKRRKAPERTCGPRRTLLIWSGALAPRRAPCVHLNSRAKLATGCTQAGQLPAACRGGISPGSQSSGHRALGQRGRSPWKSRSPAEPLGPQFPTPFPRHAPTRGLEPPGPHESSPARSPTLRPRSVDVPSHGFVFAGNVEPRQDRRPTPPDRRHTPAPPAVALRRMLGRLEIGSERRPAPCLRPQRLRHAHALSRSPLRRRHVSRGFPRGADLSMGRRTPCR